MKEDIVSAKSDKVVKKKKRRAKAEATKNADLKGSAVTQLLISTRKRMRHLKRWELKGHELGGSPNDRLL